MHRAASPGSPVLPATPDEIRAHVARLLASPAFRASKRCHRFLEYVIREMLAGNAGTIKERTLATEVFDRSPAWDSGGDDTIVRVGAREVRKRLAQYYNSPEGMQEKIRIELPLGSYVPEIVRVDYAPAHALARLAEPIDVEVPPHSTPRRRGYGTWFAAAAVLVVAVAAPGAYFALHKRGLFDQFWAPYVRSSEPILVGVASPVVYRPSLRAYALNGTKWGPPTSLTVQPLRLSPKELTGSDFVPIEDEYLAFGDSVAATSMQLLLAQHSREARLRFASHIDFSEFREGPVILIGAFTNRWTVELTQHFRFHFGYDRNWIPAILDSKNAARNWNIPQKQENGSSPEDYFLVCRLPSSPSGTPVLIAGGVEQFGTEAAGRFLSDPARMNGVLKTFGKEWPNKNLEFVMHAKVIEDSPAAPELVASYMW